MAAKRGPTLRAQWLGQQLRELREANSMTLDDAAEYLQRSPGTVSRFESGVYAIRRPDVIALLDLYRVPDEAPRAELRKISEEVWQTGWWDGYAGHDVPETLMDLTWLESRAREIRSFHTQVLPGLLQTEEYARASIEAEASAASDKQIERWVEFRTARQQVLDRDDPPALAVLLDEAMLYRPVGGAEVMRAQLRHLVKVSQDESIEVGVLPLRTGAHASLAGPFRIIEMPEPYPRVAHMDTPAGSIYVEAERVDRLAAAYDRMWHDALNQSKTVDLLSTVAEEL